MSSPFGGSGSEDPHRSESLGSQPTVHGPQADPSAWGGQQQGPYGQYGQSGPQPYYGASSRSLPIPDANPTGVTDTINLDGSGTVSAIEVGVSITHSYTCDLVVTLRSPQGASAVIADSNSCSRSQPNLTIQLDSRQGGPLAPLVGQSTSGPWTLQVVDDVRIDRGTLTSWNITVEQ